MEDSTHGKSSQRDDKASTIIQDDDKTVAGSDKPSPSKKQKKMDLANDMDPSLVRNMMLYFEQHNIDVSKLEVNSVTTATAAATASLHTQDSEMPTASEPDEHATDVNSIHEQDREPSHESAVPPEPVTGSGDGQLPSTMTQYKLH